jgi:hypothetical protein
MLIPRFSIRWLLGLTALAAVFLVIIRFAIASNVWALAVSVAVLTAAMLFVIYSVAFAFAMTLTRMVHVIRPAPKPESPFVSQGLPPQVIAPRESEFT